MTYQFGRENVAQAYRFVKESVHNSSCLQKKKKNSQNTRCIYLGCFFFPKYQPECKHILTRMRTQAEWNIDACVRVVSGLELLYKPISFYNMSILLYSSEYKYFILVCL